MGTFLRGLNVRIYLVFERKKMIGVHNANDSNCHPPVLAAVKFKSDSQLLINSPTSND